MMAQRLVLTSNLKTSLEVPDCRLERPGLSYHASDVTGSKGLPTHQAGRRHATPHMPIETAKC